ncbi:universal stress protein [Rothia terrae]|uniref:Universal stress protein n=1 Tax=Rothia terrae TaxID=396015 RepID=A0A7H2BE18_9MICC|nr:universal stress protein [Rothia terrae]QNV37914.1 universal stress protein [Rothia terrae]
MPDFYSRPAKTPEPSYQVAASERIGDAQKTVVLGYREDASARVVKETVREAKTRQAAVRVVMFSADDQTSPNYSEVSGVKKMARALIAEGLEFEIFRPASDVGQQVLDVANEHNAELIVLSIRKRSPMLKMLLGSSAQRILLDAECPVLSLR